MNDQYLYTNAKNKREKDVPTAQDHKEMVHHPEHYNKGGIEVIDFIEAWELNFSRGSAIKYICRGGVKDSEKEIEDLEKAVWYIKREIRRIENENNKSES